MILIPFGFLFAGACQWPKSSFRRKQLVLIGFALLQIVIVSAIEAMQVWFPPRVRSINDMAAGYVGGIIGVLAWQLCGEQIIQTARTFPTLSRGFPRISLVAKIAAIALVLHGMMPFDIMLTPTEWAAKNAKGNFNWMPLADVQGLGDLAKKCLLGSWAFAFGVVLAKQTSRRVAVRQIVFWCVLVELVSLPIYGRETSTTALLLSGIWGFLGVRFSETAFATARRWDRANVWLGAAASWTLAIYISFTYRFDRVVADSNLLIERMQGIWAVPFARAQRSSEFQALENISLKLAAFSLLGFLLTGWLASVRLSSRQAVVGAIAIWTLLIAVAIEVSQAFLIPLVADATDIILYCSGSLLGYILYGALMTQRRPIESIPRNNPSV